MRALIVLALLVAAGCASTGNVSARGDRAEISREEIDATSHRSALDLIRTERPHWLRPRGRTSFVYDMEVVIYVDGVRAGGPDFLSQVHPIDVESIRYYDAREAQYRFGLGHTHGAINVVTRR